MQSGIYFVLRRVMRDRSGSLELTYICKFLILVDVMHVCMMYVYWQCAFSESTIFHSAKNVFDVKRCVTELKIIITFHRQLFSHISHKYAFFCNNFHNAVYDIPGNKYEVCLSLLDKCEFKTVEAVETQLSCINYNPQCT